MEQENEVEVAESRHLIAEAGEIPEALQEVFAGCWIETVEQAVGFLCASGIEVEGKDVFLNRAREVLGDEAYARYAAPVEQHPLGCDMREAEVEVVTAETENGDVAPVEK